MDTVIPVSDGRLRNRHRGDRHYWFTQRKSRPSGEPSLLLNRENHGKGEGDSLLEMAGLWLGLSHVFVHPLILGNSVVKVVPAVADLAVSASVDTIVVRAVREHMQSAILSHLRVHKRLRRLGHSIWCVLKTGPRCHSTTLHGVCLKIVPRAVVPANTGGQSAFKVTVPLKKQKEEDGRGEHVPLVETARTTHHRV